MLRSSKDLTRVMEENMVKKCALWFLLLSCVDLVTCFPAGHTPEFDFNDEKKYDNGSVVGTYTYKDKDGNPIEVKYYADDSNYGVELKSFKVLPPIVKTPMQYLKEEKPLALDNPGSKVVSDLDPSSPKGTKDLIKDTVESRYKGDSKSDFETYYQNDLLDPNSCGKGKVRVYYDKEKRVRRMLDNFETDKYCERY